MNTQDLKLFPVTVRCIDQFLTKEECDIIIDLLIHEHFGPHNALPGNSQSSWSYYTENNINDFLSQLDKLNFVQRLEPVLSDFSKLYSTSTLKLSRIWTNIQTPGTELLPHNHPTSIISGALYLKCDDNSSDLCFLNSRTVSHGKNQEKFKISPKLGTLILFPGWLMHGSDGLNQSEQRIVLSFNTVKNTTHRSSIG